MDNIRYEDCNESSFEKIISKKQHQGTSRYEKIIKYNGHGKHQAERRKRYKSNHSTKYNQKTKRTKDNFEKFAKTHTNDTLTKLEKKRLYQICKERIISELKQSGEINSNLPKSNFSLSLKSLITRLTKERMEKIYSENEDN